MDSSGRSRLSSEKAFSSSEGEGSRLRLRFGGGTEERWRREVGVRELGARGSANIGMLDGMFWRGEVWNAI